ncbi:tRNA (adenosine(37)-N6)-dimethylallyltransferase MiaA [Brevundimonas subvibrioides]|uniref:tRNA dimethylallyltransferase n=1 Tax=Brevundimonas subvibrioides (strain ATCC 15264 / DSM 4735 / LMG 14903 / NBRC 16000 / CB 81) TaxID=633149 RepID=D9QKX9_BRESC|nr:tRNA (adenosine(37)-N6)-dimethylallyltransferase MiaA [Brevundimonas subvibrioides]ADL01793.1 tRNA delta(2)-isopentenylpyrophosphate transferase [Brevundimonas subvibrioides ATCC 15264]
MPRPSITLIAGPTASGKSRLALEIAARTGAAIVNADSQQLYADLRILTARPSPEEEAQAPHHLYGTVDAAEAWSVGRWSRAVMPLLETLRAEGRPALIVGGTGLYFNALIKGLADIPGVPMEAREEATALYDTEGEAAFRLRLTTFDPPAEAAIEAGDRQRLTRAYAVARATGRSLSDWRASTRPLLEPGTYDRRVIEPDRTALYAACDARVVTMLKTGALDEVRALSARGLEPALPAMKAVGVRELAAHLAGDLTLAEATVALQQATRNYAKRQLTWFRNQCADWPRHRPEG